MSPPDFDLTDSSFLCVAGVSDLAGEQTLTYMGCIMLLFHVRQQIQNLGDLVCNSFQFVCFVLINNLRWIHAVLDDISLHHSTHTSAEPFSNDEAYHQQTAGL
jgi:hypothetical protein